MSEENIAEPKWIDGKPFCSVTCPWCKGIVCNGGIETLTGDVVCGPAIVALTAERDALQATVDRLHAMLGVTTDGETYGRSSKVYYVDPTGFVQGLDVSFRFSTDDSVPDPVFWPYPVYSTRAAAEAAKGSPDA